MFGPDDERNFNEFKLKLDEETSLIDITKTSVNMPEKTKWVEVDFENQCLINENAKFYMDHDVLLKRALGVVLMVK